MMSEGMAELRKRYNVPAKRGMIVTHVETYYRILSSNGYYVWVASVDSGRRYKFHPFDLNYHIRYDPARNVWVVKMGNDLKAAFDARIDEWNRRIVEYAKRGDHMRIPTQQEVDEAFGLWKAE